MFAEGQIAAYPAIPAMAVRLPRLLALLLVSCAFLCSPTLYAADSGAIEALNAQVIEADPGPGFLLNGQFSIGLSDGAKEALENGVPLGRCNWSESTAGCGMPSRLRVNRSAISSITI